MKRLLFFAPSIFILGFAFPGAGFWGPVIMLGGLIFVHELGHFLVAKWMKLPVEVFSLGFGPRLIGFKWHETDVRLAALPLGGYVKLMGFNPEEPEAEDPHGFLSQPAWKRMLFYSGGKINLGIEILPTKKMQSQMSSGVAYYEGEVYNVMRQGRNSPPVPLLILGIEP